MAEKPIDPGPGQHRAWALLDDNGLAEEPLRNLLGDVLGRSPDSLAGMNPEIIGTGQVGENVRCRLSWDDPHDSGPASVVIKLASSDETSRAAAEATRTYIREVGFYRDVAATVAIRIPKPYHVSENRAENRFVLVMEDIDPARAGNQLEGCGLDQAAMAVEAAADLHGSTWGRVEEFAGFDWIDAPGPEQATDRDRLFSMLYPGFVDRYRERLTEDELAFGQWLEGALSRWGLSRSDVQCLTHGDFRLDNMLFGTGPGAPPLTTVDWQTPSLGRGVTDVAYFLSGSLKPEILRANEVALLATYQKRMAGHGIELADDALWQDYRLAAPAGFVMAVIASQLVGRTERGDDMFMVMAKGSVAQALAVDTRALVD